MAEFVGGLVSGIDSALIIEKLVSLQQRPIALIQKRQSALTTQVSALADLVSKLSALGNSAKTLAEDGIRSIKPSTGHTSFEATTTSAAVAGAYSIEVQSLATSARMRSEAFEGASSQVRAGTLQIDVQGEAFEIEIAEGATLQDVAASIAASGAPVSALVISDGRQSYLSITSRRSGHGIDQSPDSALVITQTLTGSEGTALFAEDPGNPGAPVELRAAAQNALLTIDGLAIERSSNEISDLLPGVQLSLKGLSPAGGETLILSEDRAGTEARLQGFVDAFNTLAGQLRRQTAASQVSAGVLTGDTAARSLERDLQALLSHHVPGGVVGSLAEAGLMVDRNGNLSLDQAQLQRTLEQDPAALDRLFAGTGGVGAAVSELVDKYNDADTGVLINRRDGLNDTLKVLAEDIVKKQERIEIFREGLMRQFTALEETLARLNSTKNYLDQLDKAREKK